MKRVLWLATGGTIAASQSENGLVPTMHSSELVKYISDFYGDWDIDYEDIFNMDSSNIQPEEWQKIARRIYENIDDYDGFLITHGTDTMAYTASAISFMLQPLKKSVVLTGSQQPINKPLTDARTNLYTALSAIENGIEGVSIAFNRKIMRGCRAVKVRTMGFDAFESINEAYRAEIYADGIHISPNDKNAVKSISDKTKLMDGLCTDVFLMKLLPGTKPEIFEMLMDMKYRGVILETFGAGGLHYINRNLLKEIDTMIEKGIAIVVLSQCLYENADLSIYEVGKKLLEKGVIPGYDMTTEAAATKLMWALSQTSDVGKIKKMFETNYVGEVSLG